MNQQGVSLIEVLIALVILSSSILALVALQLQSIRHQHHNTAQLNQFIEQCNRYEQN